MSDRIAAIAVPMLVLLAGIMPQPAAMAQNADRMDPQTSAMTTIGQRNPPLYDGAQALLAGRDEDGVRLTLEGLRLAQGKREEEAALSNLCAGYIRLRQFDTAMNYCNMLLERNQKSWRGYNNRAVIYLEHKEYEKADQDLKRAEAINPGAHTLKVARGMYMDAVYPVAPAVEIDDRQRQGTAESEKQR